jgi:6-pyruvoyl tetrahydropterin synthase/QueD family protein
MGFKVVVSKSNLQFAASHFITCGGKCELLHGHNYGLSLELEGDLSPDGYVFDFVVLKKIAREIIEKLDHRFLLAMYNPHLKLHQDTTSWEICYKEDRYVFPLRDVQPLPVDNITAERLAEYIWGAVVKEIQMRGAVQVVSLTVGIEETPGQAAYYCNPIQ